MRAPTGQTRLRPERHLLTARVHGIPRAVGHWAGGAQLPQRQGASAPVHSLGARLRAVPSGLVPHQDGPGPSYAGKEDAEMGEHEKQPPDPGHGTPPPGNADGEVPPQPEPDGKHRK